MRQIATVVIVALLAGCAVPPPRPVVPDPAVARQQAALDVLLPANSAPYYFTPEKVVEDTCPGKRAKLPKGAVEFDLNTIGTYIVSKRKVSDNGRIVTLVADPPVKPEQCIDWRLITVSPGGAAHLMISIMCGTQDCHVQYSGRWI
jgi:hypothetical protein